MEKDNEIKNKIDISKTSKSKRLDYIDISRFVAIFFMVLSHVQLLYATKQFIESPLGIFLEIMAGPPAAPVFMFSMGFLMTYNRNPDKIKPIRGLKIFIAGILLNFFRYIIPLLIAIIIDKEILSNLMHGDPLGIFIVKLIFQVDILFLAGIAYTIVAYMIKFNRDILPIIMFFAVAIFSPLVWGTSIEIFVFDILLDIFWGKGHHVFFPVFPWVCFPIFGAWTGYYLFNLKIQKPVTDSDNKLKIELSSVRHINIGKRMFNIGLLLLIIGIITTATNIEFHFGDYYRSGPGAIILYSGFIILWILILKQIMKKIKGKTKKMIEFVSKNLTSIYCIHWTILGWLLLLIPMNELPGLLIICLFLIIFTISVILSKYIKIKL